MSPKSIEQFEKIDPQEITGGILEYFSSEIKYDYGSFDINGKIYGIFYIEEIRNKPVIAKKNAGDVFRNGEIYYRYGGRTDKIRHTALLSSYTIHYSFSGKHQVYASEIVSFRHNNF